MVRYSWDVISPSGDTLTNKNVLFTGVGIDAQGRGEKINISLNAQAEQGEYTLSVRSIITRTSGGNPYDELVGDPIIKKFTVYKTPNVTLTLSGFSPDTPESDKEVCPADKDQIIIASADPKDPDFIYSWTNATAIASGNGDEATLNLPTTGTCEGTITEFSVGVVVSNHGCSSSANMTYNVKEPVSPTVDCSTISTLKYTLTSTQKDTVINLPVPEFSADCDPEPMLSATVIFPDGSKKEFSDVKSQSKLPITLPIGKTTVNYVVVDGCGKTDNCTITIEVKDVTPPNIDCAKIPNYTAYLSNQEFCVAVPGYFSTELPIISTPVLIDENGVDGTINGQFVGRRHGASTNLNPDISFDASALNDDYRMGITYILWAFKDVSGNTKYCEQTVSVIDDKLPSLECPSKTDLGEITTNKGECSASLDSLLAKIPTDQVPVSTDNCSSTSSIIARMFYRVLGTEAWIEITDNTTLLFNKGVNYELDWRFYKQSIGDYVSQTTYVSCTQTFTVEDKEAPDFDCNSLSTIRATVNYGDRTYEYATAEGQTVNNPATIYTLAGLLTIPEVTDNCGGEVKTTVYVENPNGTETEIDDLTALNKHKFQIGVSIIYFTFKDNADPANVLN